ncbi:MAG TPA: CPBP family intramembrane metalloprotease [candidate division WOR-3 bacterium]|uniref:CPBP family intramembrane metalloprotease n=1 Tax=candidate division WOR-3 bacterium TaxID=2052148 RepID=A0A7V0XG90_UNCW3|nr:CPBP family intramembrane metalloprotease [candidate division WOR-3 bacterium]
MDYLRGLRGDTRRILFVNTDLILIVLAAGFALTAQRYQLLPLARRLTARLTPGLDAAVAAGLVPLVFRVLGAVWLAGIVLLAIALVRGRVRDFGLAAGRPGRWLADTAIAFAVLLPLLFWVSRRPEFLRIYPSFSVMRLDPAWFAAGLGVRFAYMFACEFLFRGLLLFGFERRAGPAAAIAASTLPFALMHFGKPGLEVYGSVLAGIVLGFIALRGRSFLPCWLLHFTAAATLDVLTLLR